MEPPYNSNFEARMRSYNARFPEPQAGPLIAPSPRTYGAVTPQPGAPANANATGTPSRGAYRNLYYSTVVPGVATVIALSSYSPYDVNGFSASSEQLTWLKATLAAVDRQRTPWLIFIWHAPFYNTYQSHYKGTHGVLHACLRALPQIVLTGLHGAGPCSCCCVPEMECFRHAVEPMLLEASVDIVMLGHVHAYERTRPIYNYTVRSWMQCICSAMQQEERLIMH